MSRPTRTNTCGELNESHLDEVVELCGWVSKRRDHGGVIFVDLRDRYGLTQIVFDPQIADGGQAHEIANALRSEFVLWCRGKVRRRPDGMVNPKMATGSVEVACTELKILSSAKTPPFPIQDDIDVHENVRLKYRYLDLRRPTLQDNMMKRHRALTSVREYLDQNGFLDIETPILYKSTPEGARDFIVPSRMSPGEFYALPQSPQTLKQLLMVAGFDRYYQVARCFRDEDLRADRQPEFSQIDIETSFMNEETFYPLIEGMVAKVWKDVLNVDIPTPFARMSYTEAMTRFGVDRPDLRFGLELTDLSEIFAGSEFKVFSAALETNARGKKGSIRCIKVPGKADALSRKDLDEFTGFVSRYGAKGLLWIKVKEGGELQSPAAKFFSDEEKKALAEKLELSAGDVILCVADPRQKVVFDSLGALRLELGRRLGMIPGSDVFNFVWIDRFPLMEYDEADGRYYAAHHPFTSPRPEDEEKLIKGEDFESIEASAYDLVLNGSEVAGGSLRIYRKEVQDAMFKALGMSQEEAQEKFGFFLDALTYGTPPHGGIAFGVERLVEKLTGNAAIREVMAFPKTQTGQDAMSQTPSTVSAEQLEEVGMQLSLTAKKRLEELAEQKG